MFHVSERVFCSIALLTMLKPMAGTFGTVTIRDFPPGAYNLSVSATDVFEQSVTVVLPFTIAGNFDLMLYCGE